MFPAALPFSPYPPTNSPIQLEWPTMHTRDAFLCSQTTLLLVHRLCASYPRSKSVKVFYFFFFFACRDIDCLINVCLHDAIFLLLTVFVIRYVLIGRIFSMEIGQVSLQDNSLLFYIYIYLVNGSLVEPDRGKNTKKRVFRGAKSLQLPL